MTGERRRPDDPHLWLDRARSNLIRARHHQEGIYLEDLCFDAQQAAEKALKGLLLAVADDFPYTHDIRTLLTILKREGFSVPESVAAASELTDFAVESRYPGVVEPVEWEEYERALNLADTVVQWVEQRLEGR